MKTGKTLLGALALALGLASVLAGCHKRDATGAGPAEQAGRQIDQVTEKTGRDLTRAADQANQQIQDAASQTRQEIDKATDATGKKLEQAGTALQEKSHENEAEHKK